MSVDHVVHHVTLGRRHRDTSSGVRDNELTSGRHRKHNHSTVTAERDATRTEPSGPPYGEHHRFKSSRVFDERGASWQRFHAAASVSRRRSLDLERRRSRRFERATARAAHCKASTTSDQGRGFRKRARLWARVQGEPRSHGFQGKRKAPVTQANNQVLNSGSKGRHKNNRPWRRHFTICQSEQQQKKVPQNKSVPRPQNAHGGSKTQCTLLNHKTLGTSSQKSVWPQRDQDGGCRQPDLVGSKMKMPL